MIYGEKFLITESKEDKINDYNKLIELSKKNIDLEFKELDKRTKYFLEVFNILKSINQNNYKNTLDKALSKIQSYKSSYNHDTEWRDLKSKYGGGLFNFNNFKFMYNTPENNSNVEYFKKELDKLKDIVKKFEDTTYKDMLKFASDKEKEFKNKGIMNYNPFDKTTNDFGEESDYNAIEDLIEVAYKQLPWTTSTTMLHDFESIFKALGRKDIDIYNN